MPAFRFEAELQPITAAEVGIDSSPILFGHNLTADTQNRYEGLGVRLQSRPYIVTEQQELYNANGEPIMRDVARERGEIEAYLTSQDRQYLGYIEGLVQEFPAMGSDCRIALTIPTSTHGAHIRNSLAQWEKSVDLNGQPLDGSLYEIDMIVCGVEGSVDNGAVWEIEQFKASHPMAKVNYIEVEFAAGDANPGIERKIISDVVLMRSLARATQNAPLYIEISTTDPFSIDENTLAKRILDMDEKPYLDATVGALDFSPDMLMHDDLTFLAIRALQMTRKLMEAKQLRPGLNEQYDAYNSVVIRHVNSAISAEALALIGGYLPINRLENCDVGTRLSLMRGNYEGGKLIPMTFTVEPSPTKCQISFGPRSLLSERLTEGNAPSLERFLGRVTAWNRDHISDPTESERQIRLLATFLGFDEDDYSIHPDGQISISHIGNLVESLKRYREKHASPNVRDMYSAVKAEAFAEYSRTSPTWLSAEMPAFTRCIEQFTPLERERMRALDAACGSGRMSELLLDQGFSREHITGVDISVENIRLARKMVPGPNFRVEDVRKLRLADGSVDLIVAHMLFEFLGPEDLSQTLAEFYRVLGDDGTLIGMTTSSRAMSLALETDVEGWHYRTSPWRTEIGNYLRQDDDLVMAAYVAGFHRVLTEPQVLSSAAAESDQQMYRRYEANGPPRLLIQARKK